MEFSHSKVEAQSFFWGLNLTDRTPVRSNFCHLLHTSSVLILCLWVRDSKTFNWISSGSWSNCSPIFFFPLQRFKMAATLPCAFVFGIFLHSSWARLSFYRYLSCTNTWYRSSDCKCCKNSKCMINWISTASLHLFMPMLIFTAWFFQKVACLACTACISNIGCMQNGMENSPSQEHSHCNCLGVSP